MLRPIILATAVSGALDILWAMILTLWFGREIPNMLRFVASGPFPNAPDWGGAGAVLGLLVHFALMAVMAAAFVLAARRLPMLVDRPWLAGIGYGLVTYVVMNWIVVPLRFDTPLPPKAVSIATQLFAHVVLVGIPFALITARTLRPSAIGEAAPA
ncbi:MAG: hypothetical protein ACJ8D6_07090 [Sphingomicrobium sp.]